MPYAAVLTHVQSGGESSARLACAIDIARRFGAAIIGVGAEAITPLTIDAIGDPRLPDWVNLAQDSVEARLKVAHNGFVSATAAAGIQALWSCCVEMPTPTLAAASRAADIIVEGGRPRRRTDSYCDADTAELALTSGRPVLVAPPSAQPLSGETVLLAWKDTREARRALTDAMPFLERAERVVVTTVCPKADAEQAKLAVEDVASALRRRGVKADVRVVEPARSDGSQLLQEARSLGADLIVLGAYGHSRLGEWVFGGVTRELLRQDDVYLLLSH